VEGVHSIAAKLQEALTADVPDSVVQRLRGISIASLTQDLQRLGLHGQYLPGVLPRNTHTHFAGRAVTVRCLPAREDVNKVLPQLGESLQRLAYEETSAGQVLVFDARGNLDGGIGGDIFASRLAHNGAAALVTDGAIRDQPAMQAVNLPVFARSDHPRTFGEVHVPVDINVPIQCAGVLILPGDILVGDEEGVVAVPPAVAEKLADAGEERERMDAFTLAKIAQGAPLRDAFPPRGALREEYEALRRQQA
jgi:5-oxopent-3-ene-1,2,5-tricarboxylate decarboxylase/2-hydroxyhepta-2,4-diene-1,7-dioate isomerase